MTNLPGFHLPRRKKKKGTQNGGALFPFYTDYSRATVQAGDTNSPFAQGGPQAQPDAGGGSVTEAEGITQDDLIKEPILGSESPLSGIDEDEPEEEKKEHTYKFSCAMLNLNDSVAQMVNYWARKNIPENCLHIDEDDGMDGYEDILHVTIKYGIHDTDPTKITELCTGVGPIKIAFGKVKKFDTNPEFDVIVVFVEGTKLRQLNKEISSKMKCTDSFPTYNPHVTLAYVKKGTCDELVDNTFFDALGDTIDEVYFAAKTGDDYFISLNN